jgi:CHAT domain-containing protein
MDLRAAATPEGVVRAFYAARGAGNADAALATLAEGVEPLLRTEVKYDIDGRCLDLHSLHLQAIGETTVEAIAHVTRTPRGRGPLIEEVERRTFTFVKEGDAWKITDMPLAEEKLIDGIVAAKTDDEVTALLAAHPELITSLMIKRLVVRSIKIGRAGVGRPDKRLADIAYDIAVALDDRMNIVSAMGTQANAMRLPGIPLEPVIAWTEKSLRIAQETGDPLSIAFAANAVATLNIAVDGSSVRAEQALRQALAMQDSLSPYFVSTLYGNLGILLRTRGDYAAAYHVLMESVRRDVARGDEYALGFNEVNLGKIMLAQNDPELALDFFRRAARRKTIKGVTIDAYVGVAESSRVLGRYDEAQAAASKALEIARELPYTGSIARAQVVMTEIQIARGELSGAEATLRQALDNARAEGRDEALTESLLTLGNFYLRNGRLDEAGKLAGEALAVSTRFDFPRPARYAALMLHARTESALGNRDTAIAEYQRATEAIEAARHVVAGTERQQRLFFEPFHAAYTEAADLLLQKGAVEEALVFAERGKGRVLLDAMGHERKSAEESLEEPDRERLAALVKALGDANRKVLAQQTSAAVAEQRAAQLELERFEADLAGRHPRLRSARASSAIIEPSALPALVARPDFAILEYVVHDRATHLLVVERRGDRAAITHHRIAISAAELATRIDAYRQEVAGRDLRYRRSARALYDLLLAPAAAQLAGKRTLAIVPDGVLWRLPFESLAAPDGKFLIERAAAFYVPSISIYREMLSRQEKPSAGTHMLAAFGNPSIDESRDRVNAVYRGLDLGPLPDAEREVAAIARLWGPSSSVYMRKEAHERAARAEMQRARVVHFAAHGIFDDGNPMFSQIVLAPGETPEHDGLLQAWELARLDLAADLVVLSACDTARGKVGAGEGLIGMSWALFSAGCPSTVVAQWKVSSQSTSRLMIEFHRALSKSSSGMFAKAEALRTAQLALLRDSRTSHPFYWAAFVLVGSAS